MMKARLLLAAALMLAGISAACADDDNADSGASAAQTATAAASPPATAGGAATTTPAGRAATAGGDDATEIVRNVRESVVRIRAGGQAQRGPFGTAQPAQGTGTGFIIDQQGHIVTNNHVVTLGTDNAASNIQVDLWNGRTVNATLVGRDARTDLAVLKVDAPDLAPLQWAAPEEIAIGQEVFAIGFALDLGSSPTVTKGVVSALDRVINETILIEGRPYRIDISGAIQTDAAINPGNSGGPLVNLNGEVVGVNTAGLVSAGGQPVQGIFFAVSSQVAQPIVQTLIEEGNVERGFLGVSVATIDRQIAQANNLSVESGAGILSVEAGAAASRAGLRPGDVITKIGDMEIRNSGDIARALFRYQPGTTVPVEVVRDGQRQTVQVTLGERPDTAS
jgi:S1-C subfamily serine protease